MKREHAAPGEALGRHSRLFFQFPQRRRDDIGVFVLLDFPAKAVEVALADAALLQPARDPRCVVMQTRTEIDWAVKRRQMMVWAPSKMVLDATDGPQARDAVGLALWLAETMAADRLIVHGPVTLPAGSRVPVEQA